MKHSLSGRLGLRFHPLRGLRGAAVAVALVLGAGAAGAGWVSASFTLAVSVQPAMRLEVVSRPQALELTAADIARGYVDVETPLRIAMESQGTEGVSIVLTRVGAFVRSAQVRGVGPDADLVTATELHWRPQARRATAQLFFRLHLAPGLAPGRYPWPIQVSMSAA